MSIIMEKISFQNKRGKKLVGILHLPKEKTNLAIIISHGFGANKDRPPLIRLAETLSKDRFAVLRFDFGGCGESEDSEITLKNQADDIKSAIYYLRNNGYMRIGLLGESVGGLYSILAYDEEIKVLVLWSTETKARTSFREDWKQQLDERGFVIYKKDGKEYKFPREYFKERQSMKQEEILTKIKSPVLMIHGQKDHVVPLEHSIEAMQYLSEESKLAIIKDGDHELDDKMDKVISLSVEWFEKYMTPNNHNSINFKLF